MLARFMEWNWQELRFQLRFHKKEEKQEEVLNEENIRSADRRNESGL